MFVEADCVTSTQWGLGVRRGKLCSFLRLMARSAAVPAPGLDSGVTLSKLLSFSKSQFPHL